MGHMIIVDLQQVLVACSMQQIITMKMGAVDEDLQRHMVVNTLRAHNKKFRREYGEMILATDVGSSWRKTVFPHYKFKRKKSRDASTIDWDQAFEIINKIRYEVEECLPFKSIGVPGAEADDVIAVMTTLMTEKVLILSSDKDFLQLQVLPHVKQYSLLKKQFISSDDPKKYLKEHIIRGDSGDGIPNALSSSDSFFTGTRQKSIKGTSLQSWMKLDLSELEEHEVLGEGFKRNKTLICFSEIPVDIVRGVYAKWQEKQNASGNTMQDLLAYFNKYKMNEMLNCIGDFKS